MQLKRELNAKTTKLLKGIAFVLMSSGTYADNFVLEEIIVSAQKRDEALSSVPISLAVLSENSFKEQVITTSLDLQYSVAGLTMTRSAAIPTPYIRGIGTDITSPGVESSIAVYVDGLYQAQAVNGLVDFSNVERVEVLRGPQGTLYGRNATGGAINIISKGPRETFEFDGSVSFGNEELIEGAAFVAGPVSERVRVSLGGSFRTRDGNYNNLITGEDVNDEEYYIVDGKVEIDLSENVQAKLLAKYLYRDDTFGAYQTELSGNSIPALLGAPVATAPREVTGVMDNAENRQKNLTLGLDVKWNTSRVDIRSITGYNDSKHYYTVDFDWSPLRLIDLRSDHLGDSLTQELQFTPAEPSDKFDWIIGVFYLDGKDGFEPLRVDSMIVGLGDITQILSATVETEAYAAFGEASLFFAEGWSVTGGVRYSSEEKTFTNAAAGLAGFPLMTFPDTSEDWSDVTFRGVVKYENDDLMAFAKFETGFKSGAFNTGNPVNPGPVDPEEVTAYEMGMKVKFMGGRLRADASVFYNDYENLQIQVVDSGSGISVLDQAPKAESYGLDLSLNAAVTKTLQVYTNVNYLKAEYTEYLSLGALFPSPMGGNVTVPGVDLSGNDLVRAPELTFNIGMVRDIPLKVGEIKVTGNYYYSESYFFDPGNLVEQDSYGVLNARISYSHPSGFTFSVWGKNLTDEDYLAQALTGALGTGGYWADDASYGVTLSYKK